MWHKLNWILAIMKSIACIFTLTLVFCAGSAYAEAIFPNGHFQNGLDGWTTDSSYPSSSAVGIESLDREHYAVLLARSDGGGITNYSSLSKDFFADAGQSLTLDFKEANVFRDGFIADTSCRIEILDSTGLPVCVKYLGADTTDWNSWATGILPYSGLYRVNIFSEAHADTMHHPYDPMNPETAVAIITVYIDNVQLVPEPSTITLLIAFGLCLVACLYRRKVKSYCRLIVACVLISILTICSASAYAESIFPNGHFQNGLDGWSTDYYGPESIVQIDSIEREHCAFINAEAHSFGPSSYSEGNASITENFFADAGQSLILDFKTNSFMSTCSIGGMAATSGRIEILDSSGLPVCVKYLGADTTDWNSWISGILPYSGQYRLNILAHTLTQSPPQQSPPSPCFADAGTNIYIDNVRLVPEPGTITLLIAFGLCLAACAYRRSKRSFCRRIAAVILFSSCIAGTSQAATYSITPLDIGEFVSLDIIGVNNSGQVVGNYSNDTISSNPFIYQSGFGLQDLGTLGSNYGEAHGINNSGQVVGFSSYDNDGLVRAFLWQSDTGMQDIGTLGGNYSGARAINDNGQVVGFAETESGMWHAFMWQNGSGMQDLGTLGGLRSDAYAINNNGQVIGLAGSQSFLWQNGSEMLDIGMVGIVGIENNGRILGNHNYGNAFFRQSSGEMLDLGSLGIESHASATNDSGQVVGYSYIDDSYLSHAFLFDGSGPMQDLNDLIDPSSGWTLYDSVAISDNGLIVCFGSTGMEGSQFLLLTPVPEPSTIVLLGVGIIGLVAFTRQQRNRPM